ncbi:MFS transporter [Exophiala viscosa]|uniref:MFS transporter n=1 Tax=Exophiala viscosa TaxID=2486360 RepID=A0AAN6E142_9EURO|nr:MFS transporter [Exophiala viscosa]
MKWRLKKDASNRVGRNPGSKPMLLEYRSSKTFIIFAMCWCVFTDVFLYGIIVPVIPFALQNRVHVAHADTQHWVSVLLAVYAAALLFFSPIFGVLADWLNSRRTTLLAGLVILTGSTLMLCLGRTIPVLVVGRMLQGASASVVWVVALALMADTVSEEESGKAMGYVGLATSLGVLVAPLIGGVVYKRVGYYAVFGVTFAVIAVDVVLRLALIEKKVAQKWLEPDASSSTLSAQPSDVPLQVVVDESQTIAEKNAAGNNTEPPVQPAKRKLPTILILLKSRRILVAFWGSMVVAMTMTAIDATLPLFVNQIFGWDSLGAGLVFLALIAPSFVGPVVGHYTDKYGPRWIAASGLLLSVPLWVLLRFIEHDNTGQKVLLCVLLVLLGGAITLVMISLMAEFSKVCDAKVRQEPNLFAGKSVYAQSYSIFNSAWSCGSLLGPLIAAAIRSGAGWKTMTWTMAIFSAVGILPTFLYSGGVITRSKRAHRSGEGMMRDGAA